MTPRSWSIWSSAIASWKACLAGWQCPESRRQQGQRFNHTGLRQQDLTKTRQLEKKSNQQNSDDTAASLRTLSGELRISVMRRRGEFGGKTQADRVGGGKIHVGNLRRSLVGLQ